MNVAKAHKADMLGNDSIYTSIFWDKLGQDWEGKKFSLGDKGGRHQF